MVTIYKQESNSAKMQGMTVLASQPFARELGLTLGKDDTLSVASCWIEEPLTQHWTVAYRVLNQNGSPVIGEIRIFPTEAFKYRSLGEWSASLLGNRAKAPIGGLTKTLVAKVKVGTVRGPIARSLQKLRKDARWLFTATGFGEVDEPEIKKKSDAGRPRLPDHEYARLAEIYTKAFEEGSRNPVEQAARHCGISVSQARNRLYKARKFGFLSRGVPGMPMGEATEKTKKILEKRQQKGRKDAKK